MAADEKACDVGDFESRDNLDFAYIGIKIEGCDLNKNYKKAFAVKRCAPTAGATAARRRKRWKRWKKPRNSKIINAFGLNFPINQITVIFI